MSKKEKATFAQKITPCLKELYNVLLDHEIRDPNTPPKYPDEAMFYAAMIFIAVLVDRMFKKQKKNKMSFKAACLQSSIVGNEIHDIVYNYTDIDLKKLHV